MFHFKKSSFSQHESACDSTLNGIKGFSNDDLRICSIRPDLTSVFEELCSASCDVSKW